MTSNTNGTGRGKLTPNKKAAGGMSTTATNSVSHTDGNATPTKLETILRRFERGFSMNRFDAEHHHDHCLHSTVSTLQNGYGIKIDRMSETVPCLHGRATVRVKRYWLDTAPDNIAAARVLLAMWGQA